MLKEESINYFLGKIYGNKPVKSVLKVSDIKYIEKVFKEKSLNFDSVDSFISSDVKLQSLFSKNNLKSVYCEIDKQLKLKKALQPGILVECVIVQTLARLFEFKSFLDLESCSPTDIPIEMWKHIQAKEHTLCAARYLFYTKGNSENFLIQYGNPKMGDAAIVLFFNDVFLEIKDMPALIMDKDLYYDSMGKIIIPEEFNHDYPSYIKYINNFNKNTCVFNEIGHNYKLFDSDSSYEEKKELIFDYFNVNGADIILTVKNNNLLALKKEDLFFSFSDGVSIINTSNSEIRTSGKNSASVFIMDYLMETLNNLGVDVTSDGLCTVSKSNSNVVGFTRGRGKSEYTRFAISKTFWVSSECISETDSNYLFPLSKIKQKKLGISIHIEINKTWRDIKNELYNF